MHLPVLATRVIKAYLRQIWFTTIGFLSLMD